MGPYRKSRLHQLLRLVAEGRLRIHIGSHAGWQDAPDMIERLETGGVLGKTVLRVE
jgi:NADPH-dependent curcumin reductase CurA